MATLLSSWFSNGAADAKADAGPGWYGSASTLVQDDPLGVETFDLFSLRSLSLEVSAVMADAAPVGLALINPGTGAILCLNRTAAGQLGFAPGEAIGWRVGDLLARREDRRRLGLRLKIEGRLEGVEVAMRGRSGRVFRGRVSLRPVVLHGQTLLVASLLEVARRKAIRIAHPIAGVRHFEVGQVVADALRLLKSDLIRGHLDIDIDCPETLGIEGRPHVLARVLTQLTRNTLFHAFPSGNGGRLRIVARRRSETEVELRHEDDGLGIQPEYLDRVFDPFFTTAHSRGATGIGLTIVRTMVAERLGGSITLESYPGRGTAAVLTLPASLTR